MSIQARGWVAFAACVTYVTGCGAQPDSGASSAPETASYLYAWAGDQDEREGDANFVAVIDVDPASDAYGRVVATATLGTTGGMPHHAEQAMPPEGLPLFANAFEAGRTWLFDLSDALAPSAVGEVDEVPGYVQPHSFLRLEDGCVLATMQFGPDGVAGRPGGLARFAPDGTLMSITSSADPDFEGAKIRTYALDASAASDRILTTSSPMNDEITADVVQLWRLSDVSLAPRPTSRPTGAGTCAIQPKTRSRCAGSRTSSSCRCSPSRSTWGPTSAGRWFGRGTPSTTPTG